MDFKSHNSHHDITQGVSYFKNIYFFNDLSIISIIFIHKVGQVKILNV